MSTRPATSPEMTMSPESLPSTIMAAPNSQTISSSQLGMSESARSWPRSARKAMRPVPTPAIATVEARASPEAKRGSTTATTIRPNWAAIQHQNKVLIQPCQSPMRRKV